MLYSKRKTIAPHRRKFFPLRVNFFGATVFVLENTSFQNGLIWVRKQTGSRKVVSLLKNDHNIMKTYLYNLDPLKPHFYIVKLGFTGVDIIFLFLLKNIDCGYSSEPPRWGGSNEYPQYVLSRNMKNIRIFIWKLSVFLVVKFSIYLNRRVFVMNYQINPGSLI